LVDLQQRVAELDVALVADDELHGTLYAVTAEDERVHLIRRVETRPGDRPAAEPCVVLHALDPRRPFERLANAVDLRETGERRPPCRQPHSAHCDVRSQADASALAAAHLLSVGAGGVPAASGRGGGGRTRFPSSRPPRPARPPPAGPPTNKKAPPPLSSHRP